jgi:hypothetical protein
MLRDYIYTDEKRISSFFEQISGPQKNEKSGSLKLSFTFPKIGFESEIKNESRPYTFNEKIHLLENYFEGTSDKTKMYKKYDLEQDIFKKVDTFPIDLEFIKFLNFKANRILVSDGTGNDLIMWISSDPHIKVYLFEEMSNPDKAARWWSSYSTFRAIISEIDDGSAKIFENQMKGNSIVKFDENPLFYLNQIGKKISSDRVINCLVKVRATFMSRLPGDKFEKAIVGYPIYIY